MSGISFVDEEYGNVIDEWMNNDDSLVVRSTESDALVPQNTNTKGGLGFTDRSEPKPARGQKAKAPLKRGFRDFAEDDEDVGELHGIVEGVEESRTAIASKAKKAPVVVSTQGQSAGQKKKAKQREQKARAAALKATADSAPVFEEGVVPARPAVSTQGEDVAATGEGASEEDRMNSRKRKRVKTRSKQKNIRRDNRGDELKPENLRVGSKEYKGRPLTSATKQLLGIAN
jgi:hypothetical protein